jgi:hypothetical protein
LLWDERGHDRMPSADFGLPRSSLSDKYGIRNEASLERNAVYLWLL